MNRLLEKYKKEVIPFLKQKFGYKNDLAVPKLEKVVINVGLNKNQDEKFREVAISTLKRITGQQPVETLAKKSISAFKIRKGMVVGVMVTLRGKRMYDFIDKLISITLPRVRDFHGLTPDSLDQGGNLTIGFKEHISFPEIRTDEVEKIHGLEICLVSTAKTKEEGLELLRGLGFPFK